MKLCYNKFMKRALIFAHYDKDNIIDDYIIYYLRALKQVAETVIFVSCNNIENPECLTGLVDKIIDEPHNEYDFGSYKRGFLYLQDKLNDYDELIFANDSCYGPLYPLENIFVEMGNKKCDFWGITKNRFGLIKNKYKYKVIERPHLQSYFLVFDKNVFLSKVFVDFINSIIHLEKKNDIIINYEIALTEKLEAAGFKSDFYIRAFYKYNQALLSFWRCLIIKYKMPFLKCSILRLINQNIISDYNWRDVLLKYTDYPINFIEKNLERTKLKSASLKIIPKCLYPLYFGLIAILPLGVKKYFARLNSFLMKV